MISGSGDWRAGPRPSAGDGMRRPFGASMVAMFRRAIVMSITDISDRRHEAADCEAIHWNREPNIECSSSISRLMALLQ